MGPWGCLSPPLRVERMSSEARRVLGPGICSMLCFRVVLRAPALWMLLSCLSPSQFSGPADSDLRHLLLLGSTSWVSAATRLLCSDECQSPGVWLLSPINSPCDSGNWDFLCSSRQISSLTGWRPCFRPLVGF